MKLFTLVNQHADFYFLAVILIYVTGIICRYETNIMRRRVNEFDLFFHIIEFYRCSDHDKYEYIVSYENRYSIKIFKGGE